MPRRKPKNNQLSKEKELEIKKSLDDILLADEMLNGIESPDLPPLKPQRVVNLDNMKNEVDVEAKRILNTLADFYWDPNLLEGKEYINEKQKIDAMNVSIMAFNVRTAQHAITKLLEEIDSGNFQPRMFEVLAQLQNQMMQMPKNFSSYMTQMEKNYKQLRIEAEQKQNSNPMSVDENGNVTSLNPGDTLKVRGNKSLMEGLQNMMKTNVIVREAEIVDHDDSLVNPAKKENPLGEDGDDSFMEIDDELFDM
jgi:hypothetical protein